MDIVNYELIIDFQDFADFKRILEGGLPIDECIKGQFFISAVDPRFVKSVRLSAEYEEFQKVFEKDFVEYILNAVKDYVSRNKKN